MGLHEHPVHVVEVHCPFSCPHGLKQARERHVSCPAHQAVGGAHDQPHGFRGIGAVRKPAVVELRMQKRLHVLRPKAGSTYAVGDAASYVLVGLERKRRQQLWLAKQDQVVVGREVRKKQPELAQRVDFKKVRVVDQRDDGAPGLPERKGLFDEVPFAAVVRSRVFDPEGLAQDADGVGVGVHGP